METKTQTSGPSFTVSLRGYDREEVDDYLDSLAEALGQVDDAEERNRRLQSHINRLNARIKDLEDRIRSEEPRSGIAVGEKIGILLREAEDAAAETISLAQAKETEAEALVSAAVAKGEDQARRIEAAARGEAAEIIGEAEARASARTRQIEEWAEQVVSHTRAEEARMLREHETNKAAAALEMQTLEEQRAAAAGVLAQLREALGQALGLVGPPETSAPEEADPAEPAVATDEVDDAEAPVTTSQVSDGEGDEEDAEDTGPVDAVELRAAEGEAPAGDDDFEEKLEAWVSGEAKHFRRW